jgi:hypothetical protein
VTGPDVIAGAETAASSRFMENAIDFSDISSTEFVKRLSNFRKEKHQPIDIKALS